MLDSSVTHEARLTVVDLDSDERTIDLYPILHYSRHVVALVSVSSLGEATTLVYR